MAACKKQRKIQVNIKRRTDESVTIHDPSKAYGGYTLFAPHASTDVWLIDMNGQIVHHWKMPTPLGSDVRLLPNGNQLRINKTFKEPTGSLGTVGGEMVEVDWEGNVLWKYEDLYMHHDFCRLENGNTLINRHVLIPPEIATKVKGGIPGTELEGRMWGNAFREITPGGKVVWEWLGYKHMDTEIDVPCPICPRNIWGYVNGMDVFPNGDIVASFRHLNTLMIIDKQTSTIKWRWGKWELGHQHNPTVLSNGNILVFDNGYHRLPPYELRLTLSMEIYSQVLEVNPKTNKVKWEYKDETLQNFYSAICSSAERLPNGNTLICESTSGRIFEVTPNKEIVWEFINPFYEFRERLGLTNYIFRAHRYGYEDPGLRGKDLNPDRFEWVIREKGTPEGKQALDRLAHLGY